ncbi:LCP family protein [Streptomyces sp. DSM 41529]|uniref:LCP family protein n=1 Tax=Streptomyces lonegramiae TaxID=3075524 RepID=A0ABU2XUZ3_9ACTN|nr:LCP family protein [Streptomyces sp. DSM 41529]MDT0548860.1 LCP family protein [Streptomyces sp. DSM 41529]
MSAPARPPRPRQSSRPRWGLRIATGVAALVLLAAGVGHLLVAELESGIHRVDAFGGLDDRPVDSDRGVNFLLVGTDGRDKITRAQKRRYRLGGAPCHCTDTMMLVHLSADRDRASVVSLPRDSYARIPAYTTPSGRVRPAHPQKLNAAYAEGGPSLTVRTVEHMTRVHIDHYLEVDFTSFMKTVDVVGGVTVCTTRPLKDRYTGLNLPAGTHALDGGQALQYVRSRHLDGAADLGRIRRQQRFLAAVIHQVTGSGTLLNPVKFGRVAATLLGSVRADRGFGAADMVALGQAMRGFTVESSEFVSVPVRLPGTPVKGLGSTLRWDRVRAARLFRALRQDRPLAVRRPERLRATLVDVPPSQVRVQVFNGTHTTGLARRTQRALRAGGFATVGAPADAASQGVRHTLIEYDPIWNRSVRSLAAALPGARLKPVARQGSVMRVTLGTDFRAVHPVRAEDPTAERGAAKAVTGAEVACP